jgi:hypothetical protein
VEIPGNVKVLINHLLTLSNIDLEIQFSLKLYITTKLYVKLYVKLCHWGNVGVKLNYYYPVWFLYEYIQVIGEATKFE